MKEEKDIKYDMKKIPHSVQKEIKSEGKPPFIELRKCTRCGLCAVVCPHNAIDIKKDDSPSIVGSRCSGCMICLRECPWRAIKE